MCSTFWFTTTSVDLLIQSKLIYCLISLFNLCAASNSKLHSKYVNLFDKMPSQEVSKRRDLSLILPDNFEIWRASRKHCLRGACPISYDKMISDIETDAWIPPRYANSLIWLQLSANPISLFLIELTLHAYIPIPTTGCITFTIMARSCDKTKGVFSK